MNQEQKKRIEELRWFSERKEKLSKFSEKVSKIIPLNRLNFLSFEDSDSFQLKSEEWPKNKWNDKLYIQAELKNPTKINLALSNYLQLIPAEFARLFFMNYNFGIVEVLKEDISKNWEALVDLDGDEFFCFGPNENYFICIEKTEEILVGQEEKGFQWIYELTISNQELKNRLGVVI